MIEVINYTDEIRESTFVSTIKSAWSTVHKLRPDLPEDIKIHFTDKGIVPGLATGGYAYALDTINIAIDLNEKDTSKVKHDLTATILHEAFHLSMKYTGETGPFSLLDRVIQEGAATIFAIEYADSSAGRLYGDYKSEGNERLQEWLRFASDPLNQVLTREDYSHFAFRDPLDDTRWKLYKLGTWIVTNYIKTQSMDINDFSSADVQHIILELKSSKPIH